uniref:Uncharacterized protein n=1 Tax=Vitis vinifera TaxID=29760 RepID=F6I2N4_VITVI
MLQAYVIQNIFKCEPKMFLFSCCLFSFFYN